MSRNKAPPRVFLPGEVPAHRICVVPPEQSHHVTHVLRLSPGDAVTAFDGRGAEYPATIEHVARQRVTLRVGEPTAITRESPLAIVLAQGISSGERMDYTVQKAVELGVRAIQPVATERSVVRLDRERAAKRVAHWQGIVVASCEQCGRNVVPEVYPVAPLNTWLGALGPTSLRLALDGRAPLRVVDFPPTDREIVLLAGPEGGLSPRERELLQGCGFASVRLGPRVLRTETAAVAALAAMQTLWGDF